MKRYLFGPVSPSYAEEHLNREQQQRRCLVFDHAEGMDLTVGPEDDWETISSRLPTGWLPEFLVLYLSYMTIPEGLWSAPVPIIGLAADPNLLFHQYRRQLKRCDLVLTDTAGVEALACEGLAHTRSANLFGCERSFLDYVWPDCPRDIDILFVGSLQPAVQRERLPWLGRLARLGEIYRVAICQGFFGDEYRQLLARARIIFNFSIRGECNKRVFEAAAAGALLFQESANREVRDYFRDRQECIYYTEDDLEPLLEYYLEHEDERRAIADAARARVARYAFADLWDSHLELIEREWPAIIERSRQRPVLSKRERLSVRVWQALGSQMFADPTLVQDLAKALVDEPEAADLHHSLGLAVALASRGQDSGAVARAAAGYFGRAFACNTSHLAAGLNLAETLAASGQHQPAIRQALETLKLLDRQAVLSRSCMDAGHYPPAYDLFRVEWERAAWTYSGRPQAENAAKRSLLRWRLHSLLAEITGDLTHAYEAALARPDLPATRRTLGAALLRAGRPNEAVGQLRNALGGNPFDAAAARTLFEALGAAGDSEGQRRLARERRLVAQAVPQVLPPEPWFVNAPPIGDELASIIILCCNQVDCTRLCLQSVLYHTRVPYELVLVDNGSTDDTPTYLEQVRERSGPNRVEIIRNDTNCGFPAGCNQALARARGRYLVFLNNDTVVTEGWLSGLIGWSLQDWPNVGLVGAVSNYAPPPQQVQADYAHLSELDGFVARRRQQFVGKAIKVDRLTGFCLLVRREVLERVGGFDERFGLGFFDDDDLCVRAREAGFGLVVALDVYIHHFGSRTFQALGLDCPKELARNFEMFKAKWGSERAAGYRLPERFPVPDGNVRTEKLATDQGRPTVSLCLIVKNEQANLPACLDSTVDLFNEIIAVDTGSTDRTKEIAAQCGARVFDFPWCDSFAAARNECLRHATGDWIFWMDADDRLDDANRAKCRDLLANLPDENVAYSLKCLCLPDPVTGTATVVDHVRLFRRHPEMRWQYRVHEQILPAVRRLGGVPRWADVIIHHTGYQDPALRARKRERDLRLLHLDYAEFPDDPFVLFNLGTTYLDMDQPMEALPFLKRSLELSHPGDSIVRKLYYLVVQCHRRLEQKTEALAACQAGRAFYPEDAELLSQEGQLRRELGDAVSAEACFLRLLRSREDEHFASVPVGLHGYWTRHNLAVLYQEQRRHAEAEAQWRAALAEQPGFGPAWMGLAELYLAQRRWEELDQATARLENGPNLSIEANVFRARGYLARREFAAARSQLEACIAQNPTAVWPRVILSHVLLQEGIDWPGAEQALRDVLVLDPNQGEAKHNLTVLLRGR
jgi:GT2 family glycosyltransferase/tetratricopeptide (TPR) repeat protein